MPIRNLSSSERPRTRAWDRAQAQAKAQKAHPIVTLIKQNDLSQATEAKAKKNHAELAPKKSTRKAPKAHDRPSGVTKSRNGPRRTTKKATTTASLDGHLALGDHTIAIGKVVYLDKATQTQTQPISSWLEQVDPQLPKGAKTEISHASLSELSSVHYNDMQRRTASRSATSEDQLTAVPSERTAGTATTAGTLGQKLHDRFILEEVSKDEKWLDLHEALQNTSPPHIPAKGFMVIKKAARDFLDKLDKTRLNERLRLVEDLRFELDQWIAQKQRPLLLSKYFGSMRQKCLKGGNEAVLQKTLMISAFHHHWIGDVFEWNAEGRWKLDPSVLIASPPEDKMKMPKPDLTISFKISYLEAEVDKIWRVTPQLRTAMQPENGGGCFPFLFMEAKRSRDNLDYAELQNLHTASQALFNIYHWMKEANRSIKKTDWLKKFFDNVRVFSFTLNAQELGVRVHRAVKINPRSGDNLKFTFAELVPTGRYSREDIYFLTNSILRGYVQKELGPILLETFNKVAALSEVSGGKLTTEARDADIQAEQESAGLETERGGSITPRPEANGRKRLRAAQVKPPKRKKEDIERRNGKRPRKSPEASQVGSSVTREVAGLIVESELESESE